MTAWMILVVASMAAPQRVVPGDVALPLPRPAEPVLRLPAPSSIDSLDWMIDRGARVRVSDDEVVTVLRQHFPNLMVREGLEGVRANPALSGSARGRLAEHVWGRAHSAAEHGGFRPTANPIAPQNDFWSRQWQRGSQVKTHQNISGYLESMRKDHLAELFVVPDDQVEAVRQLWKAEHRAAVAAGDTAAAKEAVRQLDRVRPLGRTMGWLDARLGTATPLPRSASSVATNAVRSGMANAALGAGVVVALGGIDAAIALARHHNGELSGAQLNDELTRAGAQAASAGALGVVLLALPGTPVLVVIAAGVATAYATDVLVDEYLASRSLSAETRELAFGKPEALVADGPDEASTLSGLLADSELIHGSDPVPLAQLLRARELRTSRPVATLSASVHRRGD